MPPQVMRGWESVAQAGQLYSAGWNNYKTALLDSAVNDLGINRVRVEVKSGIENPVDYFTLWRNGQITESQYNAQRYNTINDNSNANLINSAGFKFASLDSEITNIVVPMRDLWTARGETLWINVCFVDFGSSAFELKSNPQEYAEFVLATYQHIQNVFGFVPDSWEVILEPDTAGASWSPQQTANAIAAAGARLTAAGYTPNFTAPSPTDAGNMVANSNYVGAINSTATAMGFVGELSYHLYAGNTIPIITSIGDAGKTYGKRTAMLELIGADYTTLYQNIFYGLNTSFEQFTLAWFLNDGGDNGGHYYVVDDSNPSAPTFTMGSRTKILRQYFKFIRTGALRIGATSNNAGLAPLAFINQNTKYVVAVKSTAGGTFTISGIPSGTCGIKYSTDAAYDIDLPDQPCASTVTTIPASGVITVYQR